MEVSKLNNWLQVSANIGIVLGLVLVGVQLKQNSDLVRIQLLYEESFRAAAYEMELIGEQGAEVWAKSIEDPENLTLAEIRVMEALLWIFAEQLRGTYRLAELGLISEQDWRDRVESDVGFYLSDPYSLAWWQTFGQPGGDYPEVLRQAIDEVIAADDRSSLEYITAPQRLLKESRE